jgi:hypothetical protein
LTRLEDIKKEAGRKQCSALRLEIAQMKQRKRRAAAGWNKKDVDYSIFFEDTLDRTEAKD